MTNYLAISALQHYAYCPRQFALIHVEQVWAENRLTAEGRILHERVDAGEPEQRGNVRYERGVQIVSERHGIRGKMDLLEKEKGDPPRFFPVEFKRGKAKTEDWDRVQLCAQAICIEEMRATQVAEGAIWYWETRRREQVMITPALRQTTHEAIEGARRILNQGATPKPIDDKKRCRACSLIDLCQPKTFRRDWTASYIEELGS